MVDKANEPRLAGAARTLLWVGRLSGYIWILLGLVGVGLSGSPDPFALAFLIGVAIASFAPWRWFEVRGERWIVYIALALSLLGPFRLLIEGGLIGGLEIPILMCIPLALFFSVLVVVRARPDRGTSGPGSNENRAAQ